MALDGIVLSNIVSDFKEYFIGGRILKIYQTEKDEIVMGIRNKGSNYKLLLTAHSNYPRAHITEQDKDNPQSPPMFCMLLRKHISGGRITNIVQPNFERIMEIHIESPNDFGDLTSKRLIIEIMGRHSNIILVDEDTTILDSIKHIGKLQSSVREVMPGTSYVYPPSQDKYDPMFRTYDQFLAAFEDVSSMRVQRRLFTLYSGMSPLVASEICHRANVDDTKPSDEITDKEKEALYNSLDEIYKDIEKEDYYPAIYKDETGKAVAFSSIQLHSYNVLEKNEFDNISALLEDYYYDQSQSSRIEQKTANMERILKVHHKRAVEKKEIQLNALKESSQRDKYKVWGELLTANVHSIPSKQDSFTTINYYEEDMPEITIPLDPSKSPIENAQNYFKIYNKHKRTEVAAKKLLRVIKRDLIYLDSLFSTLDTLEDENDIEEFRSELVDSGYLKAKRVKKQRRTKKPKPLHFISSDGFDMYVGKNNAQNDLLTLKTAARHDIWLHTKDIPGSHVIIKTNRQEVPETTIEEAAILAAYYSKAKGSSNVPIDYVERRHVRKPNGAKPGMVIYDSNKTIYVTPEKRLVDKIGRNK